MLPPELIDVTLEKTPKNHTSEKGLEKSNLITSFVDTD